LSPHARARGAEALLDEAVPQRLPGLLGRGCDHHSLAGREPVRLQHRRVGRPVHLGRGLLVRGELRPRRGGDACVAHHLLRECLAALQPRRLGGRPEGAQALRLERVHEPGHERGLGPDHGQIRTLLGGRRVDISIDGGVKVEHARPCAQHGASILVAGSAVFEAPDPGAVIEQMRAAATG